MNLDMKNDMTADRKSGVPPRLLVAGIGNIFLGDDAFGVEVAQRLLARTQPPAVRVVDFGIRGLDLTYALLDGCDAAILIDAVPRGEAPGTLFVIEPRIDASTDAAEGPPLIDAHSMDPVKVLRTVCAMGGKLGRLLLVGCEPSPLPPDVQDAYMEMESGLTEPVRAVIGPAVSLVESLIAQLLQESFVLSNVSPVIATGSGVDASNAPAIAGP